MTVADRRGSPTADREALSIMQRGREWIWITGNHDPEPATGIGGTFIETMTSGALTFRHLPTGAPARSAAICIRSQEWPIAAAR